LEVSAEVLEGQASPILSILGPKAAPYEITRDHLDVDICGVPVEDAVVIGGVRMGGFGGGLLGGVVGEAAGGIGGGIVGAYYSAIIEDFLHAHRFINPLVQDFIVDQQLVPGVVVPLKLVAPELDRDITTARVRLSSELGDVHINEFGVVANVRSEFAPTSIDACAIATPGFPLTQDPSPSFPIGPNLNSFAVVSDDLINQLSESVRRAGLLRTTYAGSNLTVGDVVDTNDPVVHLALQLAGIDAAAPLLIRSSADTSPRLLIVDDPDTQSAVEIVFRLNDVSVEMVVDRNGDGIAGRPGEECPTLHSCFSRSAPSLEDCSLFAACLDIDVSADFQVSTVASDEGPRPEILLTGVRPHPIVREPFGLVCDSPIASVGAPFLSAASGSQAIQRLFEGLELSVPPIVIKDLSLNGLVKVDHLKAIAIETNHDPSLQEYLGVAMDLEECPGSECGSELP